MTQEILRFTPQMLNRAPLAPWDVTTQLAHFAIVSYAVPVGRVRPHVHHRFQLDSFYNERGQEVVWVSMVPFEDLDFAFVALPHWTFRFGQTNYRTYVIDRQTGERKVWFFGTSLASPVVAIPRHLWQLPWHYGRIHFDCLYDPQQARYLRYRMRTRSTWAEVHLELTDTGQAVTALDGFDDLETALVRLTHPMLGVYYREDGCLGGYHIWHDRLNCTVGHVRSAKIALFDRLGLVPYAEQLQPHSVLIQRTTQFAIYLPPQPLKDGPI